MAIIHEPVLVKELLEGLAVKRDGCYLDGTLGTGGHALAVLQALGPNGLLMGCDQDSEALAVAKERLRDYPGRVHFHQVNFSAAQTVLAQEGLTAVDGIYLDLGVSMLQLKSPHRGFSFKEVGPLDMRMNQSQGMSATQKITEASAMELEEVLSRYGEERYSARIASVLKEKMRQGAVQTTHDLAQLVWEIYPPKARYQRIHPATRTFQALRIWVNEELENLAIFLEVAPSLLKPEGRLVIIAYHSLEDRLVKWAFRGRAQLGGNFAVITKKPIRPSGAEIKQNPKSRSAKLRVLQRKGYGVLTFS